MNDNTMKEKATNDDALKVDWLKGCEICSAGLCAEMDKFIEKHNMTERMAAKHLARSAEKVLGILLYNSDQIRSQYRYYKGKNNNKVEEILPPEGEVTTEAKRNGETVPHIFSRVGKAAMKRVPRSKLEADSFESLLGHARALAEGLQRWADGRVKPKSEWEMKAAKGVKDAATEIIIHYVRLDVDVKGIYERESQDRITQKEGTHGLD